MPFEPACQVVETTQIDLSHLIGKTIKSIDNRYCNDLSIEFTDGVRISLSPAAPFLKTEDGSLAIPGGLKYCMYYDEFDS